MNKQRVEIDGRDYTLEVENDEVVDVYETKSFRDTEAGELRAELQQLPDTTSGNFHAHVYETALQETIKLIGDAMRGTDLEVVRMSDSRLGDNVVYIEWEQPSAMGLYDTPDEPDTNTEIFK